MAPEMDIVAHTAQDTRELGRALGRLLKPGAVVSVEGPLGAGKTTFIDGLARGLGCSLGATSPSFALVHVYPGRIPLVHADLYRIQSPEEAEELALEEIQSEQEAVLAVEWARGFVALLPRERVVVRIEFCDEGRKIAVAGEGPEAKQVVEKLRHDYPGV